MGKSETQSHIYSIVLLFIYATGWCKFKHLNYAFNLHSLHFIAIKQKEDTNFVCVFFFSPVLFFFTIFFSVGSIMLYFFVAFSSSFHSHFYMLSLKMNWFPRINTTKEKKFVENRISK